MKLIAAVLIAALAWVCVGADVAADDSTVEKAREAQRKVDASQEELILKVQQLEDEFAKKMEPLTHERGDLLKHIKDFWGQVILAHPSHGVWTNAEDREILKNHLVDVRVETIGETNLRTGSHYKISLTFSPNHYFTDSTLWREVNGVAEDDTAKWSGLTWSEGHTPTSSSFFNFFEPRDVRANVLEGYNLNDIAHVFRYEFWPNPFTYYDLPSMDLSRHAFEHEEYLRSVEAANAGQGGIPADEPASDFEDINAEEDLRHAVEQVEPELAEAEVEVQHEKPAEEAPSGETHHSTGDAPQSASGPEAGAL